MEGLRTHFVRIFAGFVALALAACAAAPPHVAEDKAFPAPAAVEVIAAGYDNIADKYLESLQVRTIGLEALRGLGAIDPAITIEPDGKDVKISESGREIGRQPLPAEDDPRAWAQLTVAASQVARQWSSEMRKSDPEKIYEAVFDGMLSELDIYSRYSGRDEARRNRARRDGFGGIGVRIKQTGHEVKITRIQPHSPAAEAGLAVGDTIVAVDGTPIGELKPRGISELMRGPVDTPVRLLVRRLADGKEVTLDLVRQHIVPTTVTHRIEDGILYLDVDSFNQKTADSVKQAILAAQAEAGNTLKGAVLDMRGNPGGLLRQSIKLANLFLTQGRIISTHGRHPDSVHHYDADGEDILKGRPLVVLIDGKSASAAEIAAAALQDRGRAVLIGTSSYGKGSVQTVIRLPNDGELTITWSRLVTPSGYTLHGLGVHPAICTSTITSPEIGDPLLSPINDGKAQADVFSRWRRPALLAEEERAALRDICPPERHEDGKDLDLAKRLIADRALYARALMPTQATVQAGAKAAANW